MYHVYLAWSFKKWFKLCGGSRSQSKTQKRRCSPFLPFCLCHTISFCFTLACVTFACRLSSHQAKLRKGSAFNFCLLHFIFVTPYHFCVADKQFLQQIVLFDFSTKTTKIALWFILAKEYWNWKNNYFPLKIIQVLQITTKIIESKSALVPPSPMMWVMQCVWHIFAICNHTC